MKIFENCYNISISIVIRFLGKYSYTNINIVTTEGEQKSKTGYFITSEIYLEKILIGTEIH
jgi:hypothetical protein